jgi:hypothetical protein
MTIHTSPGCRIYIGPAIASTVDTEAEFEALSYTEISQVQDMGEFGDAVEDLTYSAVDDSRVYHVPGSVSAGILSLVLSYDGTNAGQAALKAAAAAWSDYAFKIELGGTPGVPPAEDALYFRGQVLGFRNHVGSADNVIAAKSDIVIISAIVKAENSLTMDSMEETFDSTVITFDAG